MTQPPRWVAPALGVALVLFGPGLYYQCRLAVKQHRLDRQLKRLSAEKAELTQERQRLTSDPSYVEGLIRSTFKVSQKGEFVVPLGDADEPRATR